ncbi:dimethylargininase [Aurantimicrobium minutum]|uniref:Dimethylarginine dimethylaminohydrolase n=1 Tax=Aurantimicrobium minutum TaxID=708131 RepID=A0A173LZ06_9MICO|nr:dimethylargininase [Aurantimicrobium minutum]BAV00104.1 dimethylarginine dimethylaminohydrolase [Aurantimicrobium minutum]
MFTPRRLLAAGLSALAVAVIAQDVTVLAFFIGKGLDENIMWQAGAFFFTASTILFFLIALSGLLGFLAKRRYSWIAGLIASAIAAITGMFIQVGMQGVGMSPEVVAVVFGSLFNDNLIFLIAGSVASVTAGTAIWRAVLARTKSDQPTKVALVRAPAANLAEGLITHIKRKKVDVDLANDQWDGYVAALNAAGWLTIEVEPRDDLADSVFIEDTVVMLGKIAVLTNPGADSRKPEIIGTEATLNELGVKIERIVSPGALDGGDVLKVGKTVYVGRGGRTNGEGIRQLRAIAAQQGYTVVAVPVTKALHLKTAVTALPDGTVIGYPPLVDDPRVFDRFLPVPEAHGTAVVVLAPDTVLMSSSAPKSAELFRELGYRVITVDISEFEKLEGCVTCLSVRMR